MPATVRSVHGQHTGYCADEPRWHNGPRPGGALTCAAYEQRRYCQNGQIVNEFDWTRGAAFNFPERACCACGRNHRVRNITITTSISATTSNVFLSISNISSSGSGSTHIVSASNRTSYNSSRCHCPGTSVCSNYSLATFMMQMPKLVRDRSSPWYTYLSTVYHSNKLPLPLNLTVLEAFYPALLPVPPCTNVSHLSLRTERRWHSQWRKEPIKSTVPTTVCSVAECTAWLPKPPPTALAARAFATGRSYVRVAARDELDDRAFGHIVMMQRPLKQRQPRGQVLRPQGARSASSVISPMVAASHHAFSWIEVSRTSFRAFPLVFTRSAPPVPVQIHLHANSPLTSHHCASPLHGSRRGLSRLRLLVSSGSRNRCFFTPRPYDVAELAQSLCCRADGG